MKTSFSILAKFLPILLCVGVTTARLSAAPTSSYPQANASAREQYILELINAARANPAGEGQMLAGITDADILRYYSYYHVNTSALTGDFSRYAAKPPLAFNPALMASSRVQATYQATAGVQSHTGPDGSTFDKRITAAGYRWSGIGENVYAYAEDPFFGHVGLNADWGVPSLDHRDNIMNADSRVPTYREVGIACVDTSIHNFGPLVITQDFGTPADASLAFVTGVVYEDANGNGVYDEGEGLGGVTVTPDAGDNYAVTTAAGGFTIPLPADGAGTLTVTAEGAGLGARRTKSVAYTAGTNTKLDFTTADASGPTLPVVSLQATVKDAQVNARSGQLLISRTGDTSQPLNVALTYGGTAVNGVDYGALPSTVTILAGAASVTLDVLATGATPGAMVKLKAKLQAQDTYRFSPDSGRKGRVRIWP